MELGDIEPAAGGDPGAQGQTADTQVPRGPKGDTLSGSGRYWIACASYRKALEMMK